MRGKVHFTGAVVVGGGITPAYAGKSYTDQCPYTYYWDHPRVCGEKTKKIP